MYENDYQFKMLWLELTDTKAQLFSCDNRQRADELRSRINQLNAEIERRRRELAKRTTAKPMKGVMP